MDDAEVAKMETNPTFQGLGEARADEVKQYLIEAGVNPTRIIAIVDKTNTVPSEEVSEADNDELRDAKTRRVTFIAK
jgi:outer membrane protein OmpA-like peptidoglycan-associated protein